MEQPPGNHPTSVFLHDGVGEIVVELRHWSPSVTSYQYRTVLQEAGGIGTAGANQIAGTLASGGFDLQILRDD
jgi:hypothetical protein